MKMLKFLIVCVVLAAMLSVPFAALAASPSVAGSNFVSTFNGSSTGWTTISGTWGLTSTGFYATSGAGSNLWTNSAHINTYTKMVYEVKLRRLGCTGCATTIVIRGNPLSLGTDHDWKTAYWFQYSNYGDFSVWKGVSGNYTALKGWTLTSAIAKYGWNTLKVIAIGPSLRFYINDIPVWVGRDTSLVTGRVGIDMYQDASAGNKLYVDWAKLSIPAAGADVLDASVAPGIELTGGTKNQSP